MYLRHFALREFPFSITPDSAFFFPHESAQAALNTLLVALRGGEGFLKIVGEVGCGKTVLCRQLLKTLQDECVTAYIPNPDMGPDDLLLALLHELNIDTVATEMPGVPGQVYQSRRQLMILLEKSLFHHAQQGRRVVVCIDEAQAIPLASIESLRLLSNLETEKQKLLQLVLLGQPELDTKLARPEIRQLLQRITFSEYLGPMGEQQVARYLQHRLAVAAISEATDTQVFQPSAARLMARLTGGVPRLVNVLSHKCLMLAYGENTHRVTPAHVRMAAADTPGFRQKPDWHSGTSRWLPAWLWHKGTQR
ncbi:AAA family ATPase [Rhodoferax sp.]|uniref:ExeA family protein n=1 Tax=Rhodoferax sp. TaxID=50421 RepID=UPI002845B0FF|nr:AAA family ATPase [Rhodoferax sp.]MDR3370380.1 AAA family ATPase [Rhodoferax sp.]